MVLPPLPSFFYGVPGSESDTYRLSPLTSLLLLLSRRLGEKLTSLLPDEDLLFDFRDLTRYPILPFPLLHL